MRISAALITLALLATETSAQVTEASQPLSAIDWLDQQSSTPADVDEDPVVASGTAPEITVKPLGEGAGQSIGLVPGSVTGMPDTIWSGTDGDALAMLLDGVEPPRLPAAQSLLYSLVLTEATAPSGDAVAFNRARVDVLIRMGALDPALELLAQAGPSQNPELFARFAELNLINGTPEPACLMLSKTPALSQDQGLSVYCAARSGDYDTAVLLFGTADALGVFPPITGEALFRYLDPETADGLPPLDAGDTQDALTFALFDALGERLPTRAWPRVFANADLQARAGWKTQIEAAERLATTGAITENRLLGLYAERRPAASGGVWDRVAAIQRLDTAIRTGSVEAVSKTLPAAWSAARNARIERQVAVLFAEQLAEMTLSGQAADIGFTMLLLSSAYETAPNAYPLRAQKAPAETAIALGRLENVRAQDPTHKAVITGFRDTPGDADILALARSGALGTALILAIQLLEDAVAGDPVRIPVALATLRALGLEDTARQAALQLMLLEGRG